jgi:Bardet-Biedl syndrome 4 protein
VACLKRALYLDPFEWITSYNLGLVHLNTGQYASAFHFFSAAINLKPDFASSYMYLAITLGRLDDFENACSAFEKAIEMEK